MNHMELSAAVHEIGLQYGSRDTHTSEELSVGRKGRETPYYYAQVWFSRGEPTDCVCVGGDDAETTLAKLGERLLDRLRTDKTMHPMARHAAMLMAAEVAS